jgi:hypothetical protein
MRLYSVIAPLRDVRSDTAFRNSSVTSYADSKRSLRHKLSLGALSLELL